VEALFYASPWPGILLWAALYVSDFLHTMACARLYQRGAREHMAFDGSYEITPYYQGDVDALRMVSPRFVFALIASCIVQWLIWRLAVGGGVLPHLYLFSLGMMINIQLTIHVRHLRNLFLFRAMLADEGIKGRIEYARVAMLRLSAVELLAFAALYAVLYAVTLSWFILGGVVICVSVAVNHRALARKHAARVEAT
jgi:hypothetical protein